MTSEMLKDILNSGFTITILLGIFAMLYIHLSRKQQKRK